jgi:hypothetical protein
MARTLALCFALASMGCATTATSPAERWSEWEHHCSDVLTRVGLRSRGRPGFFEASDRSVDLWFIPHASAEALPAWVDTECRSDVMSMGWPLRCEAKRSRELGVEAMYERERQRRFDASVRPAVEKCLALGKRLSRRL